MNVEQVLADATKILTKYFEKKEQLMGAVTTPSHVTGLRADVKMQDDAFVVIAKKQGGFAYESSHPLAVYTGIQCAVYEDNSVKTLEMTSTHMLKETSHPDIVRCTISENGKKTADFSIDVDVFYDVSSPDTAGMVLHQSVMGLQPWLMDMEDIKFNGDEGLREARKIINTYGIDDPFLGAEYIVKDIDFFEKLKQELSAEEEKPEVILPEKKSPEEKTPEEKLPEKKPTAEKQPRKNKKQKNRKAKKEQQAKKQPEEKTADEKPTPEEKPEMIIQSIAEKSANITKTERLTNKMRFSKHLKKIALSLGLLLGGAGIGIGTKAAVEKIIEDSKNNAINKEFKLDNADADEVRADAKTAQFYARKDMTADAKEKYMGIIDELQEKYLKEAQDEKRLQAEAGNLKMEPIENITIDNAPKEQQDKWYKLSDGTYIEDSRVAELYVHLNELRKRINRGIEYEINADGDEGSITHDGFDKQLVEQELRDAVSSKSIKKYEAKDVEGWEEDLGNGWVMQHQGLRSRHLIRFNSGSDAPITGTSDFISGNSYKKLLAQQIAEKKQKDK